MTGPRRRTGTFPFLLTLVATLLGGVGSACADVRLEARAWSERQRPAVFDADTTSFSWDAFPPPGGEGSDLPDIDMTWTASFPKVDGDLEDWPLVRWQQVRHADHVVRGDWRGASDAAMRTAILWNDTGLFIGFEVRDDQIVRRDASARKGDALFLSFSSGSETVQRWWRGGDRTIQIGYDGRLFSTNLLRNRRRVLFDAGVLGAEAFVQIEQGHKVVAGGQELGGTLRAEIFVPWDVLFPLLPHDTTQPLINLSYEDVDEDEPTLLSSATRVVDGTVETSYARLLAGGSPPKGQILVSGTGRHLEPDAPLEYVAVRLGDNDPWTLQAEVDGQRVQARCAAGPTFLRLSGVHVEPRLWQRHRRVPLTVSSGSWSQDRSVFAVPGADVLSSDVVELDALEDDHNAAAGSGSPVGDAFPQVADVYVRLKNITGVTSTVLGAWHERRFHDSGIAVWRASMWQIIEKRIARAELLRDQMVDPEATRERWDEAFPHRSARGVPLGRVLVRGYRSPIDGSVQPYALYASPQISDDTPVPLVVGLHSIKKNEMELFENTTLAREVGHRGWIAVCPYGRGDTGFSLTGEADVLDVIDAVKNDLPVDPTRMFAIGAGMGGTGAWLLSLRHPDLFAGATVVSALGDMDQQGFYQLLGYHPRELFHFETMNPVRLVRPGIQTHYRVIHATEDPVVPAAHANAMVQKLDEYEAPVKLVVEQGEMHGDVLLQKYLKSSMDFFAAVQSTTQGNSNPAWFGGTGGPLATVYPRGPFSIVYGTQALPEGTAPVGDKRRAGKSVTGPEADLRTAKQFALEWNSIYKGRPRLIPDTVVDDALQIDQNLVLVGDPRTNSVLRDIAADLPVSWEGDVFTVLGRTYSFEEHGVVFAAPHPTQPDRTVIVVSGMGERLGNFEKSLLKLGTDYIVTDDKHQFVDIGPFGRFVQPRTPRGGG